MCATWTGWFDLTWFNTYYDRNCTVCGPRCLGFANCRGEAGVHILQAAVVCSLPCFTEPLTVFTAMPDRAAPRPFDG